MNGELPELVVDGIGSGAYDAESNFLTLKVPSWVVHAPGMLWVIRPHTPEPEEDAE